MLLDTVNSLAPSSSTLPTSLGVAIVMGYILDFTKRLNQIPKITYFTTKLNSWIRLAMAGAGTLGISWTWSSLPNGGHQWVWTLPAGTVILAGLWHWAVQYGAQHGWEILLAQRPVAQSAMRAQQEQEPKQVVKPMGVPQEQ
jgi:hypothetical protein